MSENIASVPPGWQALSRPPSTEDPPTGLDGLWNRAAGCLQRLSGTRRRLLWRARRIVEMEGEFANLTDARLREIGAGLRAAFRRGRETPHEIDVACATIREVARRTLDQKHHTVQVAGALGLAQGAVVEMATGEGKTLTATIPATMAGWRGKGCHVVTVNDYLAQRDAEWMSAIYNFLGLRAASLTQEMEGQDRADAYNADVTYLTNKEVAADFLRDRLALGRVRNLTGLLLSEMTGGAAPGGPTTVQRGLEYAIVDEADSVLIDEAVTPLLISGEGPNPERTEAFDTAGRLAGELRRGRDFKVKEKHNEIRLTVAGRKRLSSLCSSLGGLWRGQRRREELVTQALMARQFFHRDAEYIVEDGEVVIVDEPTGRLMPDRTWRDGLHQAIEAKEGLEITPQKATFARVSFQRFFRLYHSLSGMTGTAREARREFWEVYGLPVLRVPTNRPCRREMLPPKVYTTETARWQAVVEEIREVHSTGRPVLVGTRSIDASEHLSGLLAAADLPHRVLNAVHHRREAQIVAEAGKAGAITVATNMAGRGTDIKLGRGVAELGGLHVIATEMHLTGRVDRQLFGRCARQGDPGSARSVTSLRDELPTRFAPWPSALARRLGRDGRDVSSPLTRLVFKLAVRRAERKALSQRKAVLRSDTWLGEHLGFAGESI